MNIYANVIVKLRVRGECAVFIQSSPFGRANVGMFISSVLLSSFSNRESRLAFISDCAECSLTVQSGM